MENCNPYIQHILNTTRDELLLKFWRLQLQLETPEVKPVPDDWGGQELGVVADDRVYAVAGTIVV